MQMFLGFAPSCVFRPTERPIGPFPRDEPIYGPAFMLMVIFAAAGAAA